MRNFLVFAHRGASAVAPENTRAAIAAALRAGADGVELDVQLTRDGRLVVFHDARLDRTTDGRGRLAESSYAALGRLDAGSWFHPRFSGERILLVSQVIRLAPKRLRVNLELKRTARRRQLISQLLRVLRHSNAPARVLLSSFDAALLRMLRSAPCARALICRRHPDQALQQAVRLGCQAWHPFHRLLTPARVRTAHGAGLRVHAWTVDTPSRARLLQRWGVDGVFTNDPAHLLA